MHIPLQGKESIAEVITKAFSVTILAKDVKNPPLQHPPMVADVLTEVIIDTFYN